MTTFDAPVEQACAARSGGSATDGFRTDKSPFEAVKDTPTERVDMLARERANTGQAKKRRRWVRPLA